VIMMGHKIQPVNYRRKEKTNYRKRLRILVSRKTRIVIRRSSTHIYVQAINYSPDGDKVLFTTSSKNLEKLGWKGGRKNIPTSYLTGLLAGKKAKEMGVKSAVLDIGLNPAIKGSKVFSVLTGLVDAGISIPHSEDVVEKNDRLSGSHIANHAKTAKKEKGEFSLYQKNNFPVENFPKMFEEMKKKIMGM